jgi:hypothetical protein
VDLPDIQVNPVDSVNPVDPVDSVIPVNPVDWGVVGGWWSCRAGGLVCSGLCFPESTFAA